MVFAVYYVFQIKIDNTSVKYFADHTEFRQATNYIDNNIIGVNPIEFRFDSGSEYGIYDPEYLKKVERFQEYIMSHPEYEMTYVSSIVDIIKRINKTMHGDDDSYYRIPEENEITAEGPPTKVWPMIIPKVLESILSILQAMLIFPMKFQDPLALLKEPY